MSKIVQPCEGVACYRNEANGFFVLICHFTSDRLKRGDWFDQKRRGYFNPQDAEYEHNIDFWSLGARATFWAYGKWNIVPAREVPENWDIYLSWDFGQTDPTAVLFWAQDPASKEIVVFDEIYISDKNSESLGVKNTPGDVSRLVYERIGERLHLDPYNMKMDDVLKLAVGDPAGTGYAVSYAEEPFPISIATKGFKLPFRLNDKRIGESKFNEVLRPSAVHCGGRWYAGKCGKCGVELSLAPLMTIMEGRAPNLVRTLPLIKRKKPPEEGIEPDEKDEPGQELHAVDSARYLLQFLYFQMPEAAREETAIEDMPGELLTGAELRTKIRRRLARESERAEHGVESDVVYAASEPFYTYGDPGRSMSAEEREMEEALYGAVGN